MIDPDMPEAITDLGLLLATLGEYEEARAHLERAAEMSPRDVRVHFNLGGVYYQLGEREKAMAQYRRTLELDPGYQKARAMLARLEEEEETE
ncbi:MAG: tetratricopeptide repeat protein [Planctomycetota bacterium]|nr:tetratricopeptide repeat protein [Planctomycetota bacterium]